MTNLQHARKKRDECLERRRNLIEGRKQFRIGRQASNPAYPAHTKYRRKSLNMIMVELSIEGQDGNLGMGKWPCLPNVGERLTVGGRNYTVTERAWGLACRGDGSAVMDSLGVLLSVTPEREKPKKQELPALPEPPTLPTEITYRYLEPDEIIVATDEIKLERSEAWGRPRLAAGLTLSEARRGWSVLEARRPQ